MTLAKPNRTWCLHALVLIACYALARVSVMSRLDSPIFGWRPTDLGGIALGYYRHGFHLLYPQVLWGADGPGYVEMEFPLVPFVTALLFKIFGFHELLELVVPTISGLGLVWVMYEMGRYFFQRSVGLAAGMLIAVSPTLAMVTDTGLWADPPMVLLATLGVYFIARWIADARLHWFVAGVSCTALAILVKLPALYVGIPIAYLFWTKYGRSSWRAPATWVAATLMLVPAALWYWHAHQLFVNYHNTFGILGAGYSKFGSAALLAHSSFYTKTFARIVLYHLTPLGTLACLYGGYRLVRTPGPNARFLLVFIGSVCVYALVAAGGVWDGHYHYLLPILPPLALTAGVGAIQLLSKLSPLMTRRSHRLRGVAEGLLAVSFLANAAIAKHRFENRDRMFDNWIWERKKQTGLRLKPLTRANSLLIVSDEQMDRLRPAQSMTPPDVFYFSDRRGWYLSLAWLSVERIEHLRSRGASYFVVSAQSIATFKSKHQAIFAYLSATYTKIMDDDAGVAFDLTKPATAS
jgi:4-amino-4-deoxy-L-arabinose transferase-like glycosyltransferase